MPTKTWLLLLWSLLISLAVTAQKPVKGAPPVDTSFTDYDLLFSELDQFLDSLMEPRSLTMVSIGATSAYFNYQSDDSYALDPEKKIVFTPSLAYYHKSGLGISGTAMVVHDGRGMNPYQFFLTGSYDYLEDRRLATGLMLTRFFTKDSLPFYTSPLQNEVYAYFSYRNFWIKPTIGVSYGWGSRSDFSQREAYITSIRLRPRGFTRINTKESINDFRVTATVRHDFYWLNVLGKHDFFRLSPTISFATGTQKFGLNQNTNTFGITRVRGSNVLYSSDELYLDDQLYFQPLSLSGIIKGQYSTGRFFIQPQVVFDYYFPAGSSNFSTIFMINAGVIF